MIDEISELKLIEKLDQDNVESTHILDRILAVIALIALFGLLLICTQACALNPSPCWHTDDTNDCDVLKVG